MGEIKDFTKLDVWLKAKLLANTIYGITRTFPKDELYGLTSQLRRAAISVPSNIAEGIGRNHSKETNHFLEISRGSLFEIETQVYISRDQEFISNDDFIQLLSLIEDNKKLINGFMTYYKSKSKEN